MNEAAMGSASSAMLDVRSVLETDFIRIMIVVLAGVFLSQCPLLRSFFCSVIYHGNRYFCLCRHHGDFDLVIQRYSWAFGRQLCGSNHRLRTDDLPGRRLQHLHDVANT